MSALDDQDAVALLRQIAANQRRALELQAEQIALVKVQMERSEARIGESIELQKTAVKRQAKALLLVLPLVGAALLLVGYLILRWF